MGERYDFTDVWTVPVDIQFAWRMVDDVAGWPAWWPDYRFAEIVSDVRHGPGTRWHVKVKSDLPYTVDFEFTVLAHEPPAYVKTRVEGFFEGEIDWRLEQITPDQTRLTLHEQTETRWALINLTARIGGRRLLMRNHESAMRRGELGMKQAIARGYKPPDLDAIVT
ncbi:MAG TPA: SRPBCC family protein [Candidatus Acidoferrum sp.]|nr:SRPBCC family protein [Candidatus Acidoferrum sp.]